MPHLHAPPKAPVHYSFAPKSGLSSNAKTYLRQLPGVPGRTQLLRTCTRAIGPPFRLTAFTFVADFLCLKGPKQLNTCHRIGPDDEWYMRCGHDIMRRCKLHFLLPS